jgi:general secretion pathway protein I
VASARRPRGFTLIELLVALAILAIVALSANTRTMDTLVQMQRLETRTLATWLAENELAGLRAASRTQGDGIPLGTQSRRQLMAGREWHIEVAVIGTTHPRLRRVEIDVTEARDSGEPVHGYHLVGFIGET